MLKLVYTCYQCVKDELLLSCFCFVSLCFFVFFFFLFLDMRGDVNSYNIATRTLRIGTVTSVQQLNLY